MNGARSEILPFRRTLTLALAAVAGLFTPAHADESLSSTGETMYRQFCASCHGTSGQGDGPVAGALKPPPTDLTKIRTDVPQLMKQIDGRQTIRAHGTSAMPVWGHVFEQAKEDEAHKGRAALLQVQILADHVRRLQR